MITNALTRIRFCTPAGTMEFDSKEGFENGPKGYIPWFTVPKRKTQDTLIYFGHWSTLGLLRDKNVIGLDTGCVWGGKLTAMQIPETGIPSNDLDIIQVDGYDHPLRMQFFIGLPNQSFLKAVFAAAMISSRTEFSWAIEVNPASYAEGAKYTP